MSSLFALLQNWIQQQAIVAPFIILTWSGADAQGATLLELCQIHTGFFAHQDLLILRDYSQLLQKPHPIKIEYKKSEDSDLLMKQEWYEDVGSREINERLAMSPAGEIKYVFIEHLERATTSASNALLKSFEEPLPNRCIIATTKNKDAILPTILSRALIVHCDAGYVVPAMNEDQQALRSGLQTALSSKNIPDLTKLSAQIAKQGRGNWCVEQLIAHYDRHRWYQQIQQCIRVIRMLASNVSIEHSLFQLFLELAGLN